MDTITAYDGVDPVRQSDLTVVNAMVIDGLGNDPVRGGVRIREGRITEVGADVQATSGDEALDAEGASVLPGLIDAHCHAFATYLTGTEGIPMTYVGIQGGRRLTAALRRGFTTVRDPAGGDPAFARAGREGLYASPRYLYTGDRSVRPAGTVTHDHRRARPARTTPKWRTASTRSGPPPGNGSGRARMRSR